MGKKTRLESKTSFVGRGEREWIELKLFLYVVVFSAFFFEEKSFEFYGEVISWAVEIKKSFYGKDGKVMNII